MFLLKQSNLSLSITIQLRYIELITLCNIYIAKQEKIEIFDRNKGHVLQLKTTTNPCCKFKLIITFFFF